MLKFAVNNRELKSLKVKEKYDKSLQEVQRHIKTFVGYAQRIILPRLLSTISYRLATVKHRTNTCPKNLHELWRRY